MLPSSTSRRCYRDGTELFYLTTQTQTSDLAMSSDWPHAPKKTSSQWTVTARDVLVVHLLLIFVIIVIMGVIPLESVHLKLRTKRNLITGCLKWLILEGSRPVNHALFFLLPSSKENELARDYVKRILKRRAMGFILYIFHSLLSLYIYIMSHKIELGK